ncbi:MAG TPA: hypothetical protein VIK91_09810 [Nannocystis sp.]
MTLGVYDLLDLGIPETAIVAWVKGHDFRDMLEGTGVSLPALSPSERRALADAWWFWARPGQRWQPGDEFITAYECGRGAGKTRTASEAIVEAALNPERWGGAAMIVGVTPTQVKRDCLFGQSGVLPAAEAAARSGNGPGIAERNLNDRWLRFEAPRGGGGGGLTVHWASSYHPQSVHGVNVGLVWWDEYGVSYHDRLDAQGNNAWQALLPAVRVGRPTSKIIITMTPSTRPEVRALQADAERPACPTCRERTLASIGGAWRGEPGKEPWRLPRSPQRRVHPLLDTRTTEVVRTCPACGNEVVARVRTVFGATMDNPTLDAASRERAREELATGAAWARRKYAPRGEVDAAAEGALVREEDVRVVPLAERVAASTAPVVDRWSVALDGLGDVAEVVVVVDPAVTAGAGSDESGVVAVASVRQHRGADLSACGLEDASVTPADVLAAGGGAPSLVWAPRAYWLALAWGASRIVVEVNQGGEEVLSAVRDLVRRPPTEAEAMRMLREQVPDLAGVSDARLGLLARRIAASARGVVVEALRRRAPKPHRFEWSGRLARAGRLTLGVPPWLDAAHWQPAIGHATAFEPGTSSSADKRDRWDALVSGAQVVLGVRETHRGEVEEAHVVSWVGKVGAELVGPGRR